MDVMTQAVGIVNFIKVIKTPMVSSHPLLMMPCEADEAMHCREPLSDDNKTQQPYPSDVLSVPTQTCPEALVVDIVFQVATEEPYTMHVLTLVFGLKFTLWYPLT
ncbi:hypothetical protein AVEN_268521-1, partial [Araneus ventricosus]